MKMIIGTTIAGAWLDATEHLQQSPDWLDTTLVLHIAEPSRVRKRDRGIADALDEFLVSRDQYSNHTVAETIFPAYEYTRRGSNGVFETYPDEVYAKIKDLPEVRRWGTYAHRILRRVDRDGDTYNPLKDCIARMKDSVPKKAAYEVGFGFGFDLATYDDDEDRASRLGGPCLSHLSFKLIAGNVHLTAMYRSHYYVHRAYGNLLGLARLQAFVADQVGVAVGPLVCHSTMARLEYGNGYGWAKRDVSQLIARCAGFAGATPNATATKAL